MKWHLNWLDRICVVNDLVFKIFHGSVYSACPSLCDAWLLWEELSV